MYHAIIINKQFKDSDYPTKKEIFAKKVSGDWEIYGIIVEDSELNNFITEVQSNMRPNETWYAHIYNDLELIVVFKVTPHQSTWAPIFDYGKSLGIPGEQLDFWPNRFQDEKHYFGE